MVSRWGGWAFGVATAWALATVPAGVLVPGLWIAAIVTQHHALQRGAALSPIWCLATLAPGQLVAAAPWWWWARGRHAAFATGLVVGSVTVLGANLLLLPLVIPWFGAVWRTP